MFNFIFMNTWNFSENFWESDANVAKVQTSNSKLDEKDVRICVIVLVRVCNVDHLKTPKERYLCGNSIHKSIYVKNSKSGNTPPSLCIYYITITRMRCQIPGALQP